MSRAHCPGGEDLGEDKTHEGLGREQALTTPVRGTDFQGEQSREVGQRHWRRLPRGDDGCAAGPAILGGGSATAEQRQDGMAAAKSCRGSLGGELPEG